MVKKGTIYKLETHISRQKLQNSVYSPDTINAVVENILIGIGEENFLKPAIELLYFLYSQSKIS